MFQEECERLVSCRDCGDLVSTEFGTCCEFEAGGFRCFECAYCRVARFDPTRDEQWVGRSGGGVARRGDLGQ